MCLRRIVSYTCITSRNYLQRVENYAEIRTDGFAISLLRSAMLERTT